MFALARPLIRLDGRRQRRAARQPAPRLRRALPAALRRLRLRALELPQHRAGDARYVALPAIALAIGAFLDEALEGHPPRAGRRPADGDRDDDRRARLLPRARGARLGPRERQGQVAGRDRGRRSVPRRRPARGAGRLRRSGRPRRAPSARSPPRDLAKRRGPVPPGSSTGLSLDAGRFGLQIAVACAVLFAFYLAAGAGPAAVDPPVVQAGARVVREVRARTARRSASTASRGTARRFYSKQTMIELPTQDRVVAFLRDPERVFAMVAADELAPLDAAFKQAQRPLLRRRRARRRASCCSPTGSTPGQRDDNPLRKNVWMPPGRRGRRRRSPPGAGACRVSATFDDAIELVGADFPAEVRRPGKIPLDLIFRVKAQARPAATRSSSTSTARPRRASSATTIR